MMVHKKGRLVILADTEPAAKPTKEVPVKVYQRSVSLSDMLDGRRHAWRVGPGVFEVGARSAEKRYRVDVVGGMPLCTCIAATGDGGRFRPRPCWHAGLVAKRLLREAV